MKTVLSLISGMVFILALGVAGNADELQPGDGYTSDKMIRNDDLQKGDQDMMSGTINQLPALPEAQGSAAGGVSGDDSYDKSAPVEQDKAAPADSGGTGGPSKDWNTYRY